MPMSETILYVLAGTIGLFALAAASVAWRLLRLLRYQETVIASLRQDLTSARRELSFEAERAQRILGSSAGPILTQLADHVERCAGHVEGAFVLERIARAARQRQWHLEEMDRIFLATRGISVQRPHPADLIAASLNLAHQLLEVEYRNLEVARHCQIVGGREKHWVSEVMSRLQRIYPDEEGVRLLEYFLAAFKRKHELTPWDLHAFGLPVAAATDLGAARKP